MFRSLTFLCLTLFIITITARTPRPIWTAPSNLNTAQEKTFAEGDCHKTYPDIPTVLSFPEETGYAHLGNHLVSSTDNFVLEVMSQASSSAFPLVTFSKDCARHWSLIKDGQDICIVDEEKNRRCVKVNLPVKKFVTIRSDFKQKLWIAEKAYTFPSTGKFKAFEMGNSYNTYLGNKFSDLMKVLASRPYVDNYRHYVREPAFLSQQISKPYIDAHYMKFCTHFNGLSDSSTSPAAMAKGYCSYKQNNMMRTDTVGLATFNGTSMIVMDFVEHYSATLFPKKTGKRSLDSLQGTKSCSITGDPHANTFYGRNIDFGTTGSKGTDGTYLLNDCSWTEGHSTVGYQIMTSTRLSYWQRFSIMRVMSLYYRGSMYSYRISSYNKQYRHRKIDSETTLLFFMNGINMKEDGYHLFKSKTVTLESGLQITYRATSKSVFYLPNYVYASAQSMSRSFLTVKIYVYGVCSADGQSKNNAHAICESSRSGAVANRYLGGNDGTTHKNDCKYTLWSPCTKHCGGGKQTRYLISGGFGNNGKGGNACKEIDTKQCNQHSCNCPFIAPTVCRSKKQTFKYLMKDASKCKGVCKFPLPNLKGKYFYCKKDCQASVDNSCTYMTPDHRYAYKPVANSKWNATDATSVLRRQQNPLYGLESTSTRCGYAVLVLPLFKGGMACPKYKYVETMNLHGQKYIDQNGNAYDFFWEPNCNICKEGYSYDVDKLKGLASAKYCRLGCGPNNYQVIKMRPGFNAGACAGSKAFGALSRKISFPCLQNCDKWIASGGTEESTCKGNDCDCPANNPCEIGTKQKPTGVCINKKCTSISCYANSDKPGIANGGVICKCNKGYRLASGSSTRCVNINECALPRSDPEVHTCSQYAKCTDTTGSYKCECKVDFTDTGVKKGKLKGRLCMPLCDRGHSEWAKKQPVGQKALWTGCQGECGAITKNTRRYTNPVVANIILPGQKTPYCTQTKVRQCPAQPCPPLKEHKCTTLDKNPKLKRDVIQACKTAPKDKRQACFDDCCITGDTSTASKWGLMGKMDCFAELLKQAAANPGVPHSSAKCNADREFCYGIYKFSKNHPGMCDCAGDKDVVAGPKCDRPIKYTKGHATFGGVSHPIKAQVLVTDGAEKDAAKVGKHFFDACKEHQMPKTILVFAGQPYELANSRKAKHANHMFVLINDLTVTEAGSASIEISVVNKKRTNTPVKIVRPVNEDTKETLDASTIIKQVGNRVNVQWSATRTKPVGFIIQNIDGKSFHIKVHDAKGIDQVLVGSGSGLSGGSNLEVYPVHVERHGLLLVSKPVTFSTTIAKDKCSTHGFNCSACQADPDCGYCRDSESCIPGTHAGPWRGSCTEWRFSTESDISRRVSWTPGFPVNAKHMDVYLADQKFKRDSDSELPVAITVTPQPIDEVKFDILWLVPARIKVVAQTVHTEVKNLITALHAFSQPKVAIGTYDSARNDFSMKLDWGDKDSKDWKEVSRGYAKGNLTTFSTKTDLIQSFSGTDTTTFENPLKVFFQFARQSSQSIRWRDNSRRMMFFFAGQRINWASLDKTFDADRAALLRAEDYTNFFPLFLCQTVEIKKDYDKLVDRLGYGKVMMIQDGKTSLTNHLSDLLSSVTLVLEKKGHVDTSKIVSNHVSGLKPGQKARFNFVLHDAIRHNEDKSTFVSPGFGMAVIDAVPKQQPKCAALSFKFQEDATCEGTFRGYTISLSSGKMAQLAKAMNSTVNMLSKDKIVLYYITALPAQGKLYQWNGAGPTTEFNPKHLPQLVSHAENIVFYVPPLHAHSPAASRTSWTPTPDYTSFKYATGNMCSLSNSCKVAIKIEPVDDAPTAKYFNISMLEDTPTKFDIFKHFYDPDVFLNGQHHIPQWRLKDNYHGRFQTKKSGGNKLAKAFEKNKDQRYWVLPRKDENGLFNVRWETQDVQQPALATQGFFQLNIIPVNDAPTVTPTRPYYEAAEDTTFEFEIHGRDIDSGSFSFEVEVPADFKGSIGRVGHEEPIPKGQTNSFKAPKTVRMQTTLEHSMKFRFKGEQNAFSCNLESNALNPNPKKKCDPKTDIYTQLKVRIVDKEGLKSATQVVRFIVLNVNDAPEVPHAPISAILTEEGETTVTLPGKDVDGDVWDTRIVTFPAGITVYQYNPDKSKRKPVPTSGKNKGLVTDAKHRVILVGNKDHYGNPLINFLSSPLAYQLYDGRLYSQVKEVDITVYPRNDPPKTTPLEMTTNEDEPLVVPIQVQDTDNKMTTIVFKALSLPKASGGNIFHFDRRYPGNKGAPVSVGDKIRVQNCALRGQVRNYGACVVFVPALHYHTHKIAGQTKKEDAISFQFQATDRPQFGFPGQSFTVKSEVNLHVFSINDVPHGLIKTVAKEDEYSPITLTPVDVEKDAVVLKVHDVPSEGSVYQFAENPAKASLVPIVSSKAGTKVTDSQGRVLYKGPLNKHSDSPLQHHVYQPSISFSVQETATKEKHTSALHQTVFPLAGVNDAPTVWKDSYLQGKPPVSQCYSKCTFQEDFGLEFHGNTTESRDIYFGGDDIENDELVVVIQSLNCEKYTEFFTVDDKDVERKFTMSPDGKPTVIPNFTLPTTSDIPQLRPGLKFRPGLDESNYKCTIVYKVNDGKLDSVKSRTITINITPVNDAPRSQFFNRFFLDEDTQKVIKPSFYDVEKDSFKVSIVKCSDASHGSFYRVDDKGNKGQKINCSLLGEQVVDTEGRNNVLFVPKAGDYGDDYNSITYKMTDKHNAVGYHTVVVDVIPINDAPVIYVGEYVDMEKGDVSKMVYKPNVEITHDDGGALLTKDYSFWEFINVKDVDVGANRIIDLTLHWSHGRIAMDAGFKPFRQTNSSRHYQLTLVQINEILNTLVWSTDAPVRDGLMEIRINDRGYVGLCPPDKREENQEVCPQIAKISISLNSGYHQSLIHGLVVATPVIAAAAVVVALGVMAFSSNAGQTASSPSYQPWEADGGNTGSNPLFQPDGTEKHSNIYQGVN